VVIETRLMRFIIHSILIIAIILLISFIFYHSYHLHSNLWLFLSMIGFLFCLLCSLLLFKIKKLFIPALLLSTASIVPLMHISSLVNEYGIFIPAGIILGLLFLLYLLYAKDNLSDKETTLTLMRIYLGLYLLVHASNKLFAGDMAFLENVHYFTDLNIPKPNYFVIMAGLYEFLGGLSLTLGLFTRLSAIFSSSYLLIALILGHHFFVGFIWTTAGGGWEYPVLWIVFTMMFGYLGGGKCSMDAFLFSDKQYPRWYHDFI
jgi:putative oxidoreductase